MAGLGQRTRVTPWGVVQTDARFPLVWEANQACIMEAQPDVTLDEIRATLHAALRAVGASAEHLEFWETSVESPALREARASGERFDPDVVMMLERLPNHVPPVPVTVQEVTRPDLPFWPWYRESLKEFGTPLSDPVLDQMVARVQEVFVPAGMRWFVGLGEGQRAGCASVISLGRVAYLDQVVTMPEYRRRGVAGAVVTAAVRAGLRSGNRAVFLLTEEGGAPQRLYERLGFRTVARIESFTRRMAETGIPAVNR
jgi:ribosomal protein S18 acetylase RimI-like enzyme